jgi:hypothetical protein
MITLHVKNETSAHRVTLQSNQIPERRLINSYNSENVIAATKNVGGFHELNSITILDAKRHMLPVRGPSTLSYNPVLEKFITKNNIEKRTQRILTMATKDLRLATRNVR